MRVSPSSSFAATASVSSPPISIPLQEVNEGSKPGLSPLNLVFSESLPCIEQTYEVPLEKEKVNPKVVSEKFNDDNASTNSSDITEEDCNSTFWELFTSLYLPILMVWIQRSIFGPFNIFRSIIVGHCLQILISTNGSASASSSPSPSSWGNVELPDNFVLRWIQNYLLLWRTNSKATNPYAWPPPALVVLAILTIVALIVHPDGMTWIVLRKIRDTMISLMHSSAAFWAIMVRDYGILSTLAALTTFAGLAFLAIIMYKTLSPRSSGKQKRPIPEKKKKKRKGHHARGRGGRIKQNQRKSSEYNQHQSQQTTHTPISTPLKSSSEQDYSQTHISLTTPDADVSTTPGANGTQALPDVKAFNRLPDKNTRSDSSTTAKEEMEAISNYTIKSDTAATFHTESIKEPDKGNLHSLSLSTVDTSVFSDDLSCGSASVLSARSNAAMRLSNNKNMKNTNRHRTNRNNRSNNVHRGKKYSRNNDNVDANSNVYANKYNNGAKINSSSPSRWDSLKPTNANRMGRRTNHGHQRRQGHTSVHGHGRPTGYANTHSHGRGHGHGQGQKERKCKNHGKTAKRTPSSPAVTMSPASPLRATVLSKNLPPVSPMSQSLFSCEIGASQWSPSSLPPMMESSFSSNSNWNKSNLQMMESSISNDFSSYKNNSQINQHWSRTPPPPPPGLDHPAIFDAPPKLSPSLRSINTWNVPLDASTSNDSAITATSVSDTSLWESTNESKWNKQHYQQPFPISKTVFRKPPGLSAPTKVVPPETILTPTIANALPSYSAVLPYASLGVQNGKASASVLLSSSSPSTNGNVGSSCVANPCFLNNSRVVTDNPFENHRSFVEEDDYRIEAELQELGGQMIGSVLD